MTATEKFIEDAIQGGWKPQCKTPIEPAGHNSDWSVWNFTEGNNEGSSITFDHRVAYLDPSAWRAVGKTRGWEPPDVKKSELYHDGRAYFDMKHNARHYVHVGKGVYRPNIPEWKREWHRFIDHLADDKTIEQSLSALK